MELHIISKQDNIPPFDPQAIKVQQIEYFDSPYKTYDGTEITEKIIEEVLKEISGGINIYLYLDPDGEDNWLEVNCDGEWIALGFSGDFGQNNYYSYNPAFADTVDQINKAAFEDKSIWTDLESGGQSPIPKIHAITDIELGVKAVEYFIRTGEFYPGIDWLHEF